MEKPRGQLCFVPFPYFSVLLSSTVFAMLPAPRPRSPQEGMASKEKGTIEHASHSPDESEINLITYHEDNAGTLPLTST